VRRVLLVVAALLIVESRVADAGRRFSGWLADTDVLPERTAELEWWVWESTGGGASDVVYLATAGVLGITDHLELTLPLELALRSEGPGSLVIYGADLRLRLASPDATKSGPVVPLLRLGARRMVQSDTARFELEGVVSVTAGRLRAVVNAGLWAYTRREELAFVGGGGLSWALTDELYAGAEVYAEVTLVTEDPEEERWVTAGPILGYTHGRFWITASLPIGLHGDAPDLLPRIMWGIAF
jgi:hypothetical protein